jgi:dipeptidyl aminopeptidase/acylaminoacyl peptidase
VLIGAYSDVKPEAFYVLDVATGTLDEIGGRNPDLAQTALAPMKTILVPLEHHRIPGFLTLPLDKEPQNLPLVVYPHGGPYARDRWGYDPVVQMLASRGYAVLQLNFRGSTGWGVAWLNAGWRGWGGAIHDDITSGARWAISKGIADPKRLCIVGWSYGGYAALLGAAREPALYRCAASIGGVSDLNALADEARLFHGGAMSVRESIGADKSVLESHSPLKQADRIKVPVMLIHGDADFAVLSSHSETMAKALQKQGVPTQLLVIAGGGHSLDREHERLTLLRRLEAFLAANLGAN